MLLSYIMGLRCMTLQTRNPHRASYEPASCQLGTLIMPIWNPHYSRYGTRIMPVRYPYYARYGTRIMPVRDSYYANKEPASCLFTSLYLIPETQLALFCSLQLHLGPPGELPGVQQGRVHCLSDICRAPEEAGICVL